MDTKVTNQEIMTKQETLNLYNGLQADFNEILKERIEVDLYKIDADLIPEDIAPAQLSAIMLVVK